MIRGFRAVMAVAAEGDTLGERVEAVGNVDVLVEVYGSLEGVLEVVERRRHWQKSVAMVEEGRSRRIEA